MFISPEAESYLHDKEKNLILVMFFNASFSSVEIKWNKFKDKKSNAVNTDSCEPEPPPPVSVFH